MTLPRAHCVPPVFLTAEWRSLIMVNYAIDPAVLAPHVPRGVELDLWQGEALVSMVGFLFLRTRVLGVPVPWHQDFPEVNLRFYVRRRVGGEWRRGVVFIGELVPKAAIALVARTLYNEPYRVVPMRHRVPVDGAGGAFEFSWRWRGKWHALGAETTDAPAPLAPGSAAEFIFEHYYGYTRQRDGGTVEYAVEHPPWHAWPTSRAWLDADAATLYGPAFAPALAQPPRSAFVATGSSILVRRGVRVSPGLRPPLQFANAKLPVFNSGQAR